MKRRKVRYPRKSRQEPAPQQVPIETPSPDPEPELIRPEEELAPGVRTLLYLYALFLLSLIVVHVLFSNRITVGDENGLYNAIYMYQHYGKVTYPMQLQYSAMTIHPPTHYFMVGVLAKLGFQIFHAAGIPLAVLALLSFFAILTSCFPVLEKFAVLTGFTLAALVYVPLFPIRPEMHIAFAWFCGMAFLEAARSRGWERKRLAVGGFFIAWGSSLHYWALASALVLPAYFIYMLVRPNGSRPWRKVPFLAGGALCFYIPWAVYFVIPDFSAIMQSLKNVNATGGGILAAVRNQREQLLAWAPTAWPIGLPTIGKAVFWPVSGLHLPPLVCAAAVLSFRKSLRGLVLPGAILPLFVFVGVSRKAGLFYIAPEMILYSIAVSLVFFQALDRIWRSIRLRSALACFLVACISAGAVLAYSAPFARMGVTWELTNWDVARAANRLLLGENALAALNQCYAWYTGGADRIYWIVTPGINWPWLDSLNRQKNFDSLILINDSFANRKATIPFPEFYLDRHLELRGFYFSGRRDEPYRDSLLNTLQLTARRGVPREGFAYDRAHGILNRYFEDPAGPWVFVTMKASIASPTDQPRNTVYLQVFDMETQGRQPALYAFVTTRENWTREKIRLSAFGAIRDEVSMRMETMPVVDLLRGLPDTSITFADSSALGL